MVFAVTAQMPDSTWGRPLGKYALRVAAPGIDHGMSHIRPTCSLKSFLVMNRQDILFALFVHVCEIAS